MVHFGHANLVRQAKSLGHYLIAGIHSDEEISRHKGPPVFSQEERYILLKALKWVDEVVKDAPYMTQLEVLEKYDCDFCVHGDDISVTEDGVDAYEIVKKAGKYVILRAIKRAKSVELGVESGVQPNNLPQPETSPLSAYTSGITHYMPNALRLMQFMSPPGGGGADNSLEGLRAPRPGETVVYAPGAFDLMHVGHVKFMEKCREIGSYLIVGLHSDESALLEAGRIGPILNMHERLLPLLACRYVNNVILDAPFVVTEEFLDFFKVDVVVVGTHTDDLPDSPNDPMAVPRRRGIYRRIESGSDVTTRQVIQRIIENQ
ncbi:unnamed protein product [Mesocestoides corti]|uniref:ethanolamine-phosphate cytidylyltransferase n=1 Tax=Mesocestoides corti TaxID=53468 RepID=A0A158QS96_MESCO|nr:unnamed protein product [Mesocestoides corti]